MTGRSFGGRVPIFQGVGGQRCEDSVVLVLLPQGEKGKMRHA